MKTNEFLDRFGKFNAAFSRSDAEQRAKCLRDALLIPKGPRGPHAPHLDPVHMARMLIGLTVPGAAPKAADKVTEYANMRAVGEERFHGADDFETALAAIFSDINNAIPVLEVVICRSWPKATITLRPENEGGKCEQFLFGTMEPPESQKHVCRIDYCVGWQFFDNVVSRISTEKRMQLPKEVLRDHAIMVNKIEREQGPEAAEKWAQDNPFI